MTIFIIYKVTNKINGKIYIGFTNNFKDRIYDHKNKAYKKNNKYKFHNALRKYGWDAFEWKEICCSKDGKYLLKEMEPYFIKYYDSYGKNGYNMTLGGEGCLGKKLSKKDRIKISNRQKGSNNHFYNKFHSNDSKKQMAISASKRLPNNITNYLLIDPNGKIYKISNLAKFCRKHQLNYKSFRNYIYIYKKEYKGWKYSILN